jgi:hypothetical protein
LLAEDKQQAKARGQEARKEARRKPTQVKPMTENGTYIYRRSIVRKKESIALNLHGQIGWL